jgi:proteasome activator subunit 4
MSFLQVFCFQSMFLVRLKTEWLDAVYNFVHAGLKDPRIEVRQRAAEVLGGLLHCRILTADEQRSLRTDFLTRVGQLSKKATRRSRMAIA